MTRTMLNSLSPSPIGIPSGWEECAAAATYYCSTHNVSHKLTFFIDLYIDNPEQCYHPSFSLAYDWRVESEPATRLSISRSPVSSLFLRTIEAGEYGCPPISARNAMSLFMCNALGRMDFHKQNLALCHCAIAQWQEDLELDPLDCHEQGIAYTLHNGHPIPVLFFFRVCYEAYRDWDSRPRTRDEFLARVISLHNAAGRPTSAPLYLKETLNAPAL